MGGEIENPYKEYTTFQKNGQDSFLVISNQDHSVLPYQINMIRYNSIEGMLPVNFLIDEGTYRYFYTISSKESLSGRMKGKKYSIREIRTIMTRLYDLCGKMEEYLLETDAIILHPDYIYVNQSFSHVYFCFYPEKKSCFDADLAKLMEYFMNHLDYQDENTVNITYGLYQEIRQENYSLNELMKRFCESKEALEDDFRNERKGGTGSGRQDTFCQEAQVEADRKELPPAKERKGGFKEKAQRKPSSNKKAASVQVADSSALSFFMIPAVGMALLYAAGYFMIIRNDTVRTGDYIVYAVFAISVVLLCLLLLIRTQEREGCEEVEREKKENEEPKARRRYENEHFNRGTERKEPAIASAYGKTDFGSLDFEKTDFEKTGNRNEPVLFEEFAFGGPKEEGQGNRKIPATVIIEADESGNIRNSVFVSKQKNRAQDFEVDRENLIIGKLPGVANICIYEPTVSRVHARVVKEKNKCYLIDLGSTNGTYINGKKVREREKVLLNNQDVVAFADVEYSFRM